MARALEIVGVRWSLLVVRELLLGPRRFPADDAYTLRYEDGAWTLARGTLKAPT
jgi:hypothetical protein